MVTRDRTLEGATKQNAVFLEKRHSDWMLSKNAELIVGAFQSPILDGDCAVSTNQVPVNVLSDPQININ